MQVYQMMDDPNSLDFSEKKDTACMVDQLWPKSELISKVAKLPWNVAEDPQGLEKSNMCHDQIKVLIK